MADSLRLLLERMDKEEHRYVHKALSEGSRSTQLLAIYRSAKEGKGRLEIADDLNIPKGQVSVIRNRLFTRIGDLLIDYHRNKNVRLEFGKRKLRAEIWKMKGMYREAGKEFQKLYIEYGKREFYNEALECLGHLRDLAAENNYSDVNEEDLRRWKDEQKKLSQRQSFYFELEINASLVFQRYYAKGEAPLHAPEVDIFLASLPDPEPDALAAFVYHNTRGFLFGYHQRLEHSFEEQKKALEALYRLPDVFQLRWENLVSAYNNMIITLTEMREFKKAESYLNELEKIPERRKRIPYTDMIYWLEHDLAIEFFYLMKSGAFDRLRHLRKDLEQALEKYDFNDWYSAYFRYSASYASLLAGEPDESMKWLLQLLRTPRKEVPDDIWHFANILLIILHIELKNYEIALVLLDKFKRHRDKAKYSSSEQVFLHFLMDYCKLPGGAQRNELAKNYLKSLKETLSKSETEKNVLNYIDMDIYLEAKARKQSFSEVYREKVRRNG